MTVSSTCLKVVLFPLPSKRQDFQVKLLSFQYKEQCVGATEVDSQE